MQPKVVALALDSPDSKEAEGVDKVLNAAFGDTRTQKLQKLAGLIAELGLVRFLFNAERRWHAAQKPESGSAHQEQHPLGPSAPAEHSNSGPLCGWSTYR